MRTLQFIVIWRSPIPSSTMKHSQKRLKIYLQSGPELAMIDLSCQDLQLIHHSIDKLCQRLQHLYKKNRPCSRRQGLSLPLLLLWDQANSNLTLSLALVERSLQGPLFQLEPGNMGPYQRKSSLLLKKVIQNVQCVKRISASFLD